MLEAITLAGSADQVRQEVQELRRVEAVGSAPGHKDAAGAGHVERLPIGRQVGIGEDQIVEDQRRSVKLAREIGARGGQNLVLVRHLIGIEVHGESVRGEGRGGES